MKVKHEGHSYPCDQCDFVGKVYETLRSHKRSKHDGITYPCDHCEYIGSTRVLTYTHMRFKHSDILAGTGLDV